MKTPEEVSMKICKVKDCEKLLEPNRRTQTCGMHRSRWQKYKSYDLPEKEILPENIIKDCIHHGYLIKDQVRIYKRKNRNKPQIRCKKCAYLCHKNSNQKYRERVRKADNDHYSKTRKRHLELRRLRLFGITNNKFNEMLENQNYVCAICKKPEIVLWKRRNEIKPLCIDHCHETGKIRGLLCARCNSGLGQFQDSIEVMESGIKYLKAHQ